MRELESLWVHRRLLAELSRHDVLKAYAGTATGVAWTILTPLATILTFSAIFSFGLRLPLGSAPYAFGFATAYVPWVLLAGAVTGAASSILDHRYLVKRVRFPIEVIPAGPILVHSLPHGLLVVLTAAVCMSAGYGRFPDVLLLPYYYACAAVLALGIGLWLAGLAVVLPDVVPALASFLNVWFWATPVAWSASRLPLEGRIVLAFNPASYIVGGYRHALMPEVFTPPTPYEALVFWGIAVSLLLSGSLVFRRLRSHFWECL